MDQYLPILLLIVVAAAFAGGSFAGAKLLGPQRPTAAKDIPYESGIVPRYGPASRFPVRFYLVAMIFIIFDIEVIFLYPWAVMYHQLGKFGLAEMAAFAVVVFISFAYLVSNGALDWGPRQSRARGAPRDLLPTTTSTVRRVPRPAELVGGPSPRPLDGDGDGTPGPHSEPVPAGAPPAGGA